MSDLISRQWLMECMNEGWIKFNTEKDENRFIHLVRDIASSVQPEIKTDGDTISRRDAIDAIVNTVSDVGLHDNSETARYGATFRQHEIITILKSLPSADRPTGEWVFDTQIPISGGGSSAGYRCSICGRDYFHVDGMNFCPNCGADMRG